MKKVRYDNKILLDAVYIWYNIFMYIGQPYIKISADTKRCEYIPSDINCNRFKLITGYEDKEDYLIIYGTDLDNYDWHHNKSIAYIILPKFMLEQSPPYSKVMINSFIKQKYINYLDDQINLEMKHINKAKTNINLINNAKELMRNINY